MLILFYDFYLALYITLIINLLVKILHLHFEMKNRSIEVYIICTTPQLPVINPSVKHFERTLSKKNKI